MSPQKIEILSEQARPEVEENGQVQQWLAELNENQSAKFLCSSRGSQPAAKLRWSWVMGSASGSSSGNLLGRQSVVSSQASGSSLAAEGNSASSSSSSLFEIASVSWHHHGTQLVCTATNEELESHRPGKSLMARIKLFVRCK